MSLTPRQLRRQKKKLAILMDRERKGAPISAEVAARMTQPKEDELYQVWVEPKGSPDPMPVGPKMPRQYCEEFIAQINKQIILGKELVWGNPHLVHCRIIS